MTALNSACKVAHHTAIAASYTLFTLLSQPRICSSHCYRSLVYSFASAKYALYCACMVVFVVRASSVTLTIILTLLSPIHQANNVDVVKRLCEHKADLNSGTRFDETPIDMCVLFKSLDALRMLLDLRANPDRLNRYKLTSTQMALGSGGKDVIELLVKAYRPNEREQHRMELYNRNKARFNARELAMAENTAYSEAFYAEHDRMWGPHTGYESLL